MFLHIDTTHIYQVLLSDQAPILGASSTVTALVKLVGIYPKILLKLGHVTALLIQSQSHSDRKSEDRSNEGHQWTSKKHIGLRQPSSLEAG